MGLSIALGRLHKYQMNIELVQLLLQVLGAVTSVAEDKSLFYETVHIFVLTLTLLLILLVQVGVIIKQMLKQFEPLVSFQDGV